MSKLLADVAAAALAWYVADERRRRIGGVRRKTNEAARGKFSWTPECNAEAAAYQALCTARKGEQDARRALKRACAKTQPVIIDVEAEFAAPRLIPMAALQQKGLS